MLAEMMGAPIRAARVLAPMRLRKLSVFIFVLLAALCFAGHSAAMRQDDRVIKLPIVEGTGLRFARISWWEGASVGVGHIRQNLGEYIFRIQSGTGWGKWRESATSLFIEILPHWWRSWWFRTIVAWFVLLMLWFAYRLLLQNVERRNQELARQVAERTAAEEEIKALTERLINAQEQERTRIARELHDDLNQQITGISLSLGSIRRKLPDPKSEPFQQLEGVRDQLSLLSSKVRELSHKLHPAVLDYCDIATALQSHCREFSSSTGVNVSFGSSGTFEDVSPPVALCIYRVTQEALQNVAKHAATTNASVLVERSGDALRLTVSDRGVGFRTGQPRIAGGLGLVSIKERVRLVRGVVTLESEPHRGTTLKVEIPMQGLAREVAMSARSHSTQG